MEGCVSSGEYQLNRYHQVINSGQLPADEVAQIALCIESSFGGTITREDAHNHMAGELVFVAHTADESGATTPEVAGFTSVEMVSPADEFQDATLSGEVGAYFAAAAIASAHQSRGLYRQFVDERFRFALEHDAGFIYTRTQNPRVLRGITTRLEHAIVDGEISRYALEVQLAHKAYKTMLTATKPDVRGTIFERLDYDASDAYLLTWFLS